MNGQLRAIAVPQGKVQEKVAEINSTNMFRVLAIDHDGHGFAPQGFSVIVYGKPADINAALSN